MPTNFRAGNEDEDDFDDNDDQSVSCPVCYDKFDSGPSPRNSTLQQFVRGIYDSNNNSSSNNNNNNNNSSHPDRRPIHSATCQHKICFACLQGMWTTMRGYSGWCPYHCNDGAPVVAFPNPATNAAATPATTFTPIIRNNHNNNNVRGRGLIRFIRLVLHSMILLILTTSIHVTIQMESYQKAVERLARYQVQFIQDTLESVDSQKWHLRSTILFMMAIPQFQKFAVKELDLIPTILKSMTMHENSQEVQVAGLWNLAILSTMEEYADRLAATTVVETAFHKHCKDSWTVSDLSTSVLFILNTPHKKLTCNNYNNNNMSV